MVLLLSSVAYTILTKALIANHRVDSLVSKSAGLKLKGMMSIVLYVSAIAFAFVNPWISCALYVAVAVTWVIPERQIERAMAD